MGLPVRASATVVIEQKNWYSLSYTSLFMSAFPIFPASRPASIFGDRELNFCVRYGNRWTLTPISTNYSGYTLKTEHHKESEQREKTSFTEPANYQL